MWEVCGIIVTWDPWKNFCIAILKSVTDYEAFKCIVLIK